MINNVIKISGALFFIFLFVGCYQNFDYESDQEYTVTRFSGYYQIKSCSSGKMMGKASSGSDVNQYNDNSSDNNQLWELVASGSYYKIVNKSTGTLLSVENNDPVNEADLLVASDASHDSQLWEVTDQGSGQYLIGNKLDRNDTSRPQAVDVEGWSQSDGGNLHVYDFYGNSNQKWELISAGGGATSAPTDTPAPTETPGSGWTYDTCAQYGSFSSGGYNVYNNIWGLESGIQCLYGNAYDDWMVTANLPSVGHVTSYPNTSKELSINVNDLGSCTSSFSVSRPGSGDYISAYDIWYDNYAYEVMLWMNKTGQVGPIASAWDGSGNPIPEYTNQTVGGHTWNVYKGSNGSNQVFSFVRTSNTNSGTVDIKAISLWIKDKGWFGNANMFKIEFGFEISATYQSLDFSVTGYSLSYSSGGSTSEPTSEPTATPSSTSEPTAAPTSPPGGGGCDNIVTGGSGNFGTEDAYCFKTQDTINGWGASNFDGRTISVTVNGTGTAVTTVGGTLPAKGASDYYHFECSAGSYSWASVYWW